MVAFKVNDSKEIIILLLIAVFVASSYALNLERVTKEIKRKGSSLSKKVTRNAPLILNTKPNIKKPKLISKLKSLNLADTKLGIKKSSRLPRSILIPKLPLVPFIIPLIPSLFPILPSALVPSLKSRLQSLKKKEILDLNMSKEISLKDKLRIFHKLKEMQTKGALTYPEYYKFRKMLS